MDAIVYDGTRDGDIAKLRTLAENIVTPPDPQHPEKRMRLGLRGLKYVYFAEMGRVLECDLAAISRIMSAIDDGLLLASFAGPGDNTLFYWDGDIGTK